MLGWGQILGRHLLVLPLLALAGCSGASSDPKSGPSLPKNTQTTQGEIDVGTGGNGEGESGNIANPWGAGGDQGVFDLRPPAQLAVSPTSFDFQIQSLNSSTYATFTVTNVGGKPAANLGAAGLSGPYSFRHGSFPGLGGTCSHTLNGGQSCKIVVGFQPGTLSAFPLSTFNLVYDGATTGVHLAIPLKGAATDIATLQFSNQTDDEPSYDFGSVTAGTNTTKAIVLQYFGALPATGVTFSDLNPPFSLVSTTCGNEVDQLCNVVLRYTGSTLGHFQQALKVTYNNGSYAAESVFTLKGDTTALIFPATLAITDGGTNSWGQVFTGQSYDKTFTVTRSGTFPATSVSAASFASPAFTFKGGTYPGEGGTCSATITSACTVVMTLATASSASLSDNLTLSFHNGTANTQASRAITALVSRPAMLTLTPDSAVDFGSTPIRLAVSHSFTLTNTAGFTASSIAISGLSAPFSSTGGCATLAPGASCTFIVLFTPTGTSPAAGAVAVSYFNGLAYDRSLDVSLTGQGTTGAFLVPSVTSYNFGSVLVGSAAVTTVTFSYYGMLPAQNLLFNGLAVPFAFSGGSYPGGGTCGATISAQCTVKLAFSPTVAGAASNTVNLQYDDGTGSTQTVALALSGTGVAVANAALNFSVATYDFGSVLLGSGKNATLTINRTGNQSASSLSLSGLGGDFTFTGGSFPGTGGTCPTTLSTASCRIAVTFRPSAIGARGPQTVTLDYFNGTSNQQASVVLNGTGIDIAVVATSPLAFGSVAMDQTPTGTVTFTNTGTQAATNFALNTGFMASAFTLVSTTCGTNLAASTSCTATVRFSPISPIASGGYLQAGFHNGSISAIVNSNLSGTGTVSITMSASLAGFGSLPILTSLDRTVTLTNSGTRTATNLALNSPAVAAPYSVASTTCGTSLAGGTSCTAVVRFAPTNAGSFPASFAGSYATGAGTATFSAAVTGAATISITISAGSANFGTMAMGLTEDRTITLSNSGVRTASAFQILTNTFSAPFSLASTTCGPTLAGGGSCSAVLRFAPTAPGNFTQIWNGSYFDGVSTVGFSGSAQGTATIAQLIAANGNHSCARTQIGQLKCWGQNNYGQLGLGDFTNRGTTPFSLGTNLPAVSLGASRYPTVIALGYWHSCAILDDGKVKCWGANTYGQLGLGVSSAQVGGSASEMGDNLAALNLGAGFRAVSLALGYGHSCALSDAGKVKCWGQNSGGQLGLGDTGHRGKAAGEMGASLPTVDLGSHTALEISANTSHTCAVLEDHSVRCWGNNFFGQLGIGDIQNRGDGPGEMGANLPAVDLGTGETARSVTAGGAYTCALLTSGSVKCWGRNEHGILGTNYCQDGSARVGLCSDASYPLPLRGYGIAANQMGDRLTTIALGSHAITQIVASDSSTCALFDNHAVKCWGENTYGQLGLGDTTDRGLADGSMGSALPELDLGTGLEPVTLTSGDSHSCLLSSSGQVKCWGYNRFGGLGLGDAVNRGDGPSQMGDLLGFTSY